MKIEEELLNNIEEVTVTKYKNYNCGEYKLVSEEEIYNMLSDLVDRIKYLMQQKKEMEQDIEDNYKKISVKEQYE